MCVEYVKDEYSGDLKSEWSRIKRDEFLKLKYWRKERKEYIIHFTGFNVAVIRCWRREADIVEVSLCRRHELRKWMAKSGSYLSQ